jgi:hypothetical protein
LQDTLTSLSDFTVARVDVLRDIDSAKDLKDLGSVP